MIVKEVPYCKESVTPDNVYIIDNGLKVYQVNFSISPSLAVIFV